MQDHLPAVFPPSVLVLIEPEGSVAFTVPDAAALQQVAADVLAIRFVQGWYHRSPDLTLQLVRARVAAIVTGPPERKVETGTPSDAWYVLDAASRAYGHTAALLPLTPPMAYAARRRGPAGG